MTRAYIPVRKSKLKFPVKPARSPQGRINSINSVGSTNDHYLPSAVQAIHEGQQCGYNGTMNLILSTGTHRSQSIYLIKEYDSWPHAEGLHGNTKSEMRTCEQQI